MKKRDNDDGTKRIVVIASAEPELRKRWALGIQNNSTIHEVSDLGELERCMANSRPAVLLLDLDLPHMGEVRGVPAIQRLCPSSRIILFAGANDERQAICALKAGARGYCTKEIDPSHLRKAVNVVQKGEVWVGRKTICHLLEELISRSRNGPNGSPPLEEVYLRHLTPREQQIALLVGSGACNKEISNRLNISERTVKAHLTAIFHKLQITDRLRLGLFVAAQNHANPAPPPSIKPISDQSPMRPKSN
jgi:two-component system nitrate/nitrite response regulator NarL